MEDIPPIASEMADLRSGAVGEKKKVVAMDFEAAHEHHAPPTVDREQIRHHQAARWPPIYTMVGLVRNSKPKESGRSLKRKRERV